MFSSRDLKKFPLTTTELDAIKNDFLEFILDRYTFLKQEDRGASTALKDYQSSAARPNILTFLRGRGYSNFSVANVRVSYNSGDYMSLLRPNSFRPSGTSYSSIGLSLTFSEGMIEVFAIYL